MLIWGLVQITFTEDHTGLQFFLDTCEQESAVAGDKAAARFFLQASMGPTRSMIDAEQQAFGTDGTAAAKDWIQAQIALPASSHREYFRKRANIAMETNSYSIANVNNPCGVGSRWHNWSFTTSDVGKSMVFSTGELGQSVITVDAVRRTEVGSMALLLDIPVSECSASSEYPNLECGNAFPQLPGTRFFAFNTAITIGQWLKATFAQDFSVQRFGWRNRGEPRNIKDVILKFSDDSTQTATLPRAASTCNADNMFGCGSSVTPVSSSWVKITVSTVYPATWNGDTWADFGHMGAYDVKFWGAADTPNSGTPICSVEEMDGGIMTAGVGCDHVMFNPTIKFALPGSNNIQQFGETEVEFSEMIDIRGVRIMSAISANCSFSGATDQFVRLSTDAAGSYYKHDRSIELLENTLEHPATVQVAKVYDHGRSQSGSMSCPTVPKTFMNKDSCVKAASCLPTTFSTTATVTLNEANLRQWYILSSRYIYYVTGLVLDPSTEYSEYGAAPCMFDKVSRWRRHAGSCASVQLSETADNATKTTIAKALAASQDTNELVRDILLMGTGIEGTCNNVMGMVAEINGNCFQHVHKDEHSVIDFSYWARAHNGNAVALAAGRPNPIKRFAETGSVNLMFPADHPDSRWRDFNTKSFNGGGESGQVVMRLGRFGDTVVFNQLPGVVKTSEMAVYLNAEASQDAGGMEVCGSLGELANDPTLGRHYWVLGGGDLAKQKIRKYYGHRNGKTPLQHSSSATLPTSLFICNIPICHSLPLQRAPSATLSICSTLRLQRASSSATLSICNAFHLQHSTSAALSICGTLLLPHALPLPRFLPLQHFLCNLLHDLDGCRKEDGLVEFCVGGSRHPEAACSMVTFADLGGCE